MSTEVASLLATAEVEVSDAEKNLDQLSQKFDQTAKNVEQTGDQLKGTESALDQTGESARAVSKDFENLTRSPLAFANSSTQAFQATSKEAGNTGVAFASMARIASSSGRGIEALFRGNVLAAMRDFGMASRAAFNANSPLNFTSNVKASSAALKESAALVTSFSGVLVKAGKDTEVNDQLIEQFGIKASAAFLNPTLATQKFVAGLSQVESAEERATIVQNLFGASSVKMYPIIEGQIALYNQQSAAVAALMAAEERSAAARAALIAETQAATSTVTGDVLATEGLAAAEAEATASTQALAAAEAELTAVQQGMGASSTAAASGFALSGGAITMMVAAAALLTVGLYKLLTAQEEVIVVSKQQIDVTARRVAQAQTELAIAQALKATTDDEKQAREALIAAKRQELQVSADLLKTQDYATSHALIVALENQEKAILNLNKAEELHGQSKVFSAAESIIKTDAISKDNEALAQSYETTHKAAEAVTLLAQATGRSTSQVFEEIAARIRQTHSTAEATKLQNDLAHALNGTINAEGHLVFETDSATAALNANTEAVRRNIAALQARGNLASAIIEQAKAAIAERGLTGKAAVDAFKQEQQKKPIVPFSGIIGPTTLGEAVSISKQQEATNQSIDDYLNPPSGGGGRGRSGAAAAKQELNAMLELWKIQETALKRHLDVLSNDNKFYYEEGIKSLDQYIEQQKRIEESGYRASLLIAQQELRDVERSRVTGDARKVAIAKAQDAIQALTDQHDKKLSEIDREAHKERESAERAFWDRKFSLNKIVTSGEEEIWRRMAERGTATFEEAYKVIEGRQRELLVATKTHSKELLDSFLSKGGNTGSEKYKQLFSDVEKAEQELENFDKKTLLDIQDNHLKDVERTRQWANDIQDIYDSIFDSQRATESARLQLLEQMGTQHQALRRKQLDFDLQSEEIESARRLRQLEQERQSVEQSLTNQQYKADKLRAINAQIEQEEAASQERRQNIVDKYYQEERARLKDQADKIVGVLEKALNGLKTDGWHAFFKSLLQDLDNFIEQSALKVLKSDLLKLLEHINHVPAQASGLPSDPGMSAGRGNAGAGGILNTILGSLGIHVGGNSQQSPGQAANTTAITVNTQALHQLSEQLRRSAFDPTGQTRPRRVSDGSVGAIDQAGRSMTGAIKSAGVESRTGVDQSDKASAGAILTMGQGIVSTLTQIASIIANQNARGGFWSGLFMSMAAGALNGIMPGLGGLVSGMGGGANAGKSVDYSAGKGGESQPMRAGGGLLSGPGTGTSDSILAMDWFKKTPIAWVSNDEYVVKASSVAKLGKSTLDFINTFGQLPAFPLSGQAGGGLFADSYVPPISQGYRSGHNDNRIYNFNHYVTVQGDTRNPQEVGKTARQIARDSARFLQGHLSD